MTPFGHILQRAVQATPNAIGGAFADADGEMVPSRHATDDELIALCRVTGRHPGTTLEFIPGVPPFEEYAPALMARMSAAANRPLNWNVLFVNAGRDDITERLLGASDVARDHGGRVLALTLPDAPRPRICFGNGFLRDTIPG